VAGQIVFAESTVDNLFAEFPSLMVAIDYHVPGDFERFGQGRVNPRTAALLKINDGDAMGVQGPAKRCSERVDEKVF
jgi:hypothetical protein